MPDTSIYSAKSSLAYAKLVATPTDTSWSQVYNAGNLFACLSLIVKPTTPPEDESTEEAISLQALGKEVFNILESEFFSLPEKTNEAIKKAIQTSVEHVPASVSVNLSLAVFKETVLSVFIAGAGKIIMKRGGQIGVLLEQSADNPKTITFASGYLENKDTVVIETEQFAHDITPETVASALELAIPNDIAEVLSPQIHEKDDGGQAAIVIVFHGVTPPIDDDELVESVPPSEKPDLALLYAPKEADEVQTPTSRTTTKKKWLPKITLPTMRLPHQKKLFLSVAVVLVVLLVTSIFLATKNQEDAKRRERFQAIYTPAEKLYDEGKGLESLNANLSRENFLKAESLVKDGQKAIKKGTPEAEKLQALLAKIQSEIKPTQHKRITAKEAKVGENSFLSLEKTHADGLAFGQNTTTVYFITNKAVMSIDKTSGNKKDVIPNNDDWQSAKGIVPYQGNIYVLDTKTGVLKYSPSGDGFGKSSYFKKSPDLSKATGMAVDGSVWIIFSDGTIMKYTKGESDGFKMSRLEKPLRNPTKIFTDLDTDNVYILDSGNARVVRLSKEGTFQAQYPSNAFSVAEDFEILEKDKKILTLSDGKIWEIEMK